MIPAGLYNMLVEIIETGNEQELLLFQQFDIPLDLIVVSRRRARALAHENLKGTSSGVYKTPDAQSFTNGAGSDWQLPGSPLA